MSTSIVKKSISKDYCNVCYVESIYALALFVFINKCSSSNTLFITSEKTYIETVFSHLDNYIVISSSFKKMSTIERFFYVHGAVPKRFKPLTQYFNKNMSFFGHDHLRHSFIFIVMGMTLIEDGLKNYDGFHVSPIQSKRTLKEAIYDFLNISYKTIGYDKRVKKIYLSGILPAPKELIHKVQYFKKEDFFESLATILNGALSFQITTSGVSILMTQPLSEDKILTEQEKLSIYRQIIINLGCEVLIKPHPRDLSDYLNCFKDLNIKMLPKHTLAEAIVYNNTNNITSALTLFSTSNYNLKDIKGIDLVILGTTFNQKLMTRCGEIEINNPRYKHLLQETN